MTEISPTADLPPSLPPSFRNADECRAWLERAPRTDAAQMQASLLREANRLNLTILPPADRLDILETLREALIDTQEEFGRKFAGKPLPLTDQEQAAFDSCRALWHGLASGYMRCLEACFAEEAGMKSKATLVLQRALAALVAEQYETHRAGQVPPAEHWRVVNELFAAAEQLGVADQTILDTPRLGKTPVSPAATYAEALLLQAANLHEHGQRHIGWIARWARRWSAKVRLLASPPTLSTRAIPLCIDLAADKPSGYMPLDTPGARWLETVELQRSLKKRLLLLEQGEPPAKLHLGDDCTQPACGQILAQVYQRWCKGGAIRGFERRPASGGCRFVAGIEAIHYYLSDHKPFKQPGGAGADMLRREREEIATFGRISARHDEKFSEQHGYAIEQWQVLENWHMVDASATGMRIGRPLRQGGIRIAHGQLIATCPDGAQAFLLGGVSWSLVGEDFQLELGVHLFPGRAEPVAFRGTGPAAAGEPYRQAFLLPAVATLKQPASIVMPVGGFKLNRIVDTFTSQSRPLRLTRLMERGSDYERAAFEPV